MSDANLAQNKTEVSGPQPDNAPTESTTTEIMTSQSANTPEAKPFTLPDLLIYGSFLNYNQILSLPLEEIPLADIDDIMRTAAQYTIEDIVQHVNRNNTENATTVLTAEIVGDLIKLSIKRLAKSRATTITNVKKEFEAKQKENGIVKGKYVNDAQPDAIFHPSGVDGGF
ncbi:hypothetical protein AC578_5732 [Pseudocercospora eumusae]|uniref:Uncharacterized protein n=1 Tax=Pseudocercospora eumusae TaxID=321146 RepID=A0A139HET8_9PEZI|nr:hypothetical protein AC578_5732 [Pseudocercospora eumusae]